MIVYRELSSLCQDLGYSARTLYTLSNTVSIPKAYKKKIRQELYYCRKYGIEEHIRRLEIKERPERYLRKLIGRINYVLCVEPENEEFKAGKEWASEEIKRIGHSI